MSGPIDLTGHPDYGDGDRPSDTPKPLRMGRSQPPAISRREVMLGRLVHLSVQFLKREDGPTAAEYAIMLALIMAVIITVSGIGATTKSSYENPVLQDSIKPAAS